MKYTIQLGFYTLAVEDMIVEAPNKLDAIAKALDECTWEGQRTIYDCCTNTRVLEMARGDHDCAVDAPEGAKLKLPFPEEGDPLDVTRQIITDLLAAFDQSQPKRKRERACENARRFLRMPI